MEIVFLPKALEDQEYWKSIGDKRIMNASLNYWQIYNYIHLQVLENQNR